MKSDQIIDAVQTIGIITIAIVTNPSHEQPAHRANANACLLERLAIGALLDAFAFFAPTSGECPASAIGALKH